MRQESTWGPAHLHRSAKEVAAAWMESASKVNMTISSLLLSVASRERAHVPFFHPPPPQDISPLLSAPPRHRRRHELPPAPVQPWFAEGVAAPTPSELHPGHPLPARREARWSRAPTSVIHTAPT